MEESKTIPGGYTLAEPGTRILAYLIDYGVVIGAYAIIAILYSILPFSMWFLISIISLLVWLGVIAYFLLKDALYEGQSFGKKMMKIQVINAETGAPIKKDFGKSALRNLLMIISIVELIIMFVSGAEKNYQRLGDQVAKTIVVKQK